MASLGAANSDAGAGRSDWLAQQKFMTLAQFPDLNKLFFFLIC